MGFVSIDVVSAWQGLSSQTRTWTMIVLSQGIRDVPIESDARPGERGGVKRNAGRAGATAMNVVNRGGLVCPARGYAAAA